MPCFWVDVSTTIGRMYHGDLDPVGQGSEAVLSGFERAGEDVEQKTGASSAY